MKLFDLDKLIDTFTGFIETKIELVKLDAKEELSGVIAKAIVFFSVAVFALLALLFISLGTSSILNSFLENDFIGYLIVGVIYLIVGATIYANKESILTKIREQAQNDNKEEDL
ncbi:phage holin family protein [Roseivirga sp. E12]|uniref:phage holin family protein n=1 Tax=Roseivirga sp. E12 TaxID=2819237 RepID=UPI001ABC5794|nr:phage holin family protein [Roseivirga sp. E12]MBO3699446.1 phage holin family protein [Roseivirga sp. E12]